MDSRWLHRAAGTVGLASGFLLLGAGTAQADEAEEAQLLDGLLSEVFSPTSNLPPLDLSTDTDPVLGGLPRGEVPLDGLGFPGGAAGGLPTDGLLKLDGATIGLPNRFATPDSGADAGVGARVAPATDARTLPASDARILPANDAPILPASDVLPATDVLAATDGGAAPATGRAEIVGPALLSPITDGLLGGASLGKVLPAGGLVGQVPVAGPMIAQTTNGLPLVDGLVPGNGPAPQSAPAGPAGPAPAAAEQVPAVIAQELVAEGGYSPELLDDRAEVIPGIPLLGPALEPLGKMFGVGNLPAQLPVVGPLAGPLLGKLPVVNDPSGPGAPPAAAQTPAGPAASSPAAPPAAAGAGATEERPYAGEDPEYPAYDYPARHHAGDERSEFLPLGGLTQALPLDLLAAPLSLLRTLPLPV